MDPTFSPGNVNFLWFFLPKRRRASFMYASSSSELWNEILDHYGQLNALELYQLKKDLGQISQENHALIDYYGDLKRTWEHIDSIDPLPICTCGAMKSCTCQLLKRILDRETHSKLIQLLMGLNSSYETIITHVLSMESLPPLNKTLGLLLKIEKQKQIIDVVDTSVVSANSYTGMKLSHKSVPNDSNAWKRPISDYDRDVKLQRECDDCLRKGRSIDECFKLKTCSFCNLNGHIKARCYKYKAHIAKSGHNVELLPYGEDDLGYVSSNPLDILASPGLPDIPSTSDNSGVTKEFVQGLFTNMMNKVMQAFSDSPNSCQGMHSVNFAGTFPHSHAFSVVRHFTMTDWITDTGATDHMTSQYHLLHNVQILRKPIYVLLPDGTTKMVTWIGDVILTNDITLLKVLFLPEFRQNLLSVSKLIETTNMTGFF